MNKKTKRLIMLNAPYVLIGLLATNLGEAWRLAIGSNATEKVQSLVQTIPQALSNPLPSLHPFDLMIGAVGAGALRLAVYLKGKNAKKFRTGSEYGSAKWGTSQDIEPFMDPDFKENVILTKTERLMMSGRPSNPKYARNKNVLVVGGSGSGKTRFFLLPNLLQMHSSYVVTDPKGDLIGITGKALLRNGYNLKVFNTINFKKSMHYNPLAYIHSEKDILKLVNTLIANTKGDGKAGDEFWQKAETLLYTALIGYIHYEAPPEEQNFSTLLEFLNAMEVREDDEDFKNPVDLMFDELEKKNPNHFAVRQYKKYLLAAGKTAKSILVSCGARLAPFDIEELREITEYDELALDTLGDRKSALFLIMSDTDSTFNFLISMVYTQLFNLLCEKADDVYGGRLPVHVRCLIDEAANIGQIPNLEKLVATIRSREISACLILQAKSQLIAPSPIKKKVERDIVDNSEKNASEDPLLATNLTEKIRKEEVEIIIPRFHVVTVFDYSQTEGKELPSIGVDELTGNVDGYENIISALEEIAPFPIERGSIESGAKGYFSPSEQKIMLQDGMSEIQTVKTLIHETAHALLHDKDGAKVEGVEDKDGKSRNSKEVEAESVAYTVCDYLGIDTGDYSFGYIAGWSRGRELKELKESMETIRKTASKIISGIEDKCFVKDGEVITFKSRRLKERTL